MSRSPYEYNKRPKYGLRRKSKYSDGEVAFYAKSYSCYGGNNAVLYPSGWGKQPASWATKEGAEKALAAMAEDRRESYEKDGWCNDIATHTIHEDNWTKAIAEFRHIKPCECCEECRNSPPLAELQRRKEANG